MKDVTKKPSKQRKRLYEAPKHRRGKIISSHLSSELKSSYNVRAAPVRTGDTVKILRGDHKGFEGKVTRVDRKKYRIFIEGITREKADGTTIPVPIHASKVEIINLNLDDKWRKEVFEKKRAFKELKQEEKIPEKMGEPAKEGVTEKITVSPGGT